MPHDPLRRRDALALIAGGALTALAPEAAEAGRRWCRVDPLIRILPPKLDPQLIHIWVAIRAEGMPEARRLVQRAVRIKLHLPPGVQGERIDRFPGFGGGFNVTVHQSDNLRFDGGVLPVQVRAWIPTNGNRRHRVELEVEVLEGSLIEGQVARGKSNSWVDLSTPSIL